jgi:hypothetical protein
MKSQASINNRLPEFPHYFANYFLKNYFAKVYRAFAHDVTAAMLVFEFERILIRLFCLEHQHGRHGFC